jgi:hypothetical protein
LAIQSSPNDPNTDRLGSAIRQVGEQAAPAIEVAANGVRKTGEPPAVLSVTAHR